MKLLMALLIGFLFAAGLYMMLRRSIVKLIIGLIILSHAANLLIFTSRGMVKGKSPVILADQTTLAPPFADPVPQALILTAIVISFGVQAFAIILVKKVYQKTGTDDLDDLRSTDTI
jgi:multicomponent Na+:H+ antiporter subunit C